MVYPEALRPGVVTYLISLIFPLLLPIHSSMHTRAAWHWVPVPDLDNLWVPENMAGYAGYQEIDGYPVHLKKSILFSQKSSWVVSQVQGNVLLKASFQWGLLPPSSSGPTQIQHLPRGR